MVVPAMKDDEGGPSFLMLAAGCLLLLLAAELSSTMDGSIVMNMQQASKLRLSIPFPHQTKPVKKFPKQNRQTDRQDKTADKNIEKRSARPRLPDLPPRLDLLPRNPHPPNYLSRRNNPRTPSQRRGKPSFFPPLPRTFPAGKTRVWVWV